jgi:hypothetical protein
MKRIVFAACLSAMVLPFTPLRAQSRSDFSGRWAMDASRSESVAGDLPVVPVTVVIRQTGSELTIETTRPDDNRVVTYKLDGSETVTPTVRSSMRWDGQQLVTTTTYRVTEGWIMTLYETRSLNAGGKEMTIDIAVNVQHGYSDVKTSVPPQNYRPVKDVFTKTAP